MSVLHAVTKKTTPPGNIDRLQAELRSELPGATAVSLPEQVGGDHIPGPCQPWDLIKAMKSSGNLSTMHETDWHCISLPHQGDSCGATRRFAQVCSHDPRGGEAP